MKTLAGIYSTDGLSRSGVRFSIGALDDMVWKGSETGTPLNLSHDVHRFIGWTKISGLYVSHELSYVIGHTFLPESDDELEKINKMRNGFLKGKMFERINDYQAAFFNELSASKLDNAKGKFFCNGMVMYSYPGVVEQAFPWLNEKKDKDGLVLLKDLYDNSSLVF